MDKTQNVKAADADYDPLEEEIGAQYAKYRARKFLFVIVCVIITVILVGVTITVGQYKIGFFESYQIIWNHICGNIGTGVEAIKDHIIWNLRLPRITVGIIAGFGLAVAGTTMQSAMKNPLADPYTTGISAGASFGATLAIIFGASVFSGPFAIVGNAFLFSLIPMVIIIGISGVRKMSPTMMVLTGIAVMYVFNAMTTFIMLISDPQSVAAVYAWQVGTLSKAAWNAIPIMFGVVTVGSVLLMSLSNKLNVMASGEECAKSLGLDTKKLRILCLLIVSMMTAGIVSFTGIIGFVGLLAPHIVRIFIGSDNRFLLPASGAFGAALLLFADLVGRTVIMPAELQVGVVTAFLGGPMFIYLMIKQKRSVW